MSTHDDEVRLDPRLRTALDHAPDQAQRPSPALREAVLRAAREAAARQRPLPWWRRPWVGGPGPLGLAASVATVGLGLSLAWHLSTVEPLPEPRVVAQAAAPMAEKQASAHAPVAKEEAYAPPPATAPPRMADETSRQRAAPTRRAPAPAAQAPAPADTAAAPAAAPSITTATAPPPAPKPAAAEAAPAPVAEARLAPAAPVPAQPLAADSVEQRPLAAKSKVAPSGLRAEAPTWPAPLARWSQALFDAGVGVDLPEGWQRVQPTEPAGTPAARRDWWLALLGRTAGRWASEPPPAPDATRGPVLQLRAPDGALLTLWMDAQSAWLQADGHTWRAPRPSGLAPAP